MDNQRELIEMLKVAFFEWKPFLPFQSLMGHLIGRIDSDTRNDDMSQFQETLASKTILSTEYNQFATCPVISAKFVKRFLLLLEEHGIEGHDSFYDFISNLSTHANKPDITSNSMHNSKTFYKSYFNENILYLFHAYHEGISIMKILWDLF